MAARVAGEHLIGGEVNTRAPFAVGVNESPVTQNLDPLSMTGAATRTGRATFGVAQGSGAGTKGLRAWQRNNGTDFLIARQGTTFYNVSALAWASIGIGGTSDAFFRAQPLLDVMAIVVDGLAPKKWDGTTFGALGGTPPANAKYACVFVSKILLSGDPANPQRVTGSATNNGEDYTAANDAFSITSQSGGGDKIRGLMANRKVAVFMYRHRIEILSGTTIADFSVQVLMQRGLVSETGYVSAGEVCFFCSDEAIYMITGFRVTDLTTMKFRETYLAIPDKSKITLGLKRDLLIVCDYGSGKAYCCDFKRNKWATWADQYWEAMDTANDETLYGGPNASTTQIYALATGTLDGASAITAKWRTPNLGFGWMEAPKGLAATFVHAKPGIATVSETYYSNGSAIGSVNTLAFSATGGDAWQRVAGQSSVQGQQLAMEIQWTGVGTIYGWAMYAEIQVDRGDIPRE